MAREVFPFDKPTDVRDRVGKKVEVIVPCDDMIPGQPIIYNELQLHTRVELFQDAQVVLCWGGISHDDVLLLKAAARVLLLRGVAGGDFDFTGPAMTQEDLRPAGNSVRN